nr:hypothetical protein [Tanacetum cinerariifolium]
ANDQEAEEGILYGCDQKQLGVEVKRFKGSKEETKRLKRKGLNLEKEQVKKQKSSEEPPEIETSTDEFTEEKMKEMMQLVPVEVFMSKTFKSNTPSLTGREDLNQLWALVKEYLSIRPVTNDKEMELWVELKRMYEPDPENQLQRDLYASRKRLSTQKGFSTCDDQLQASVKVVATARRKEMPLPKVCTTIEEKKKKLSVKDRWQLH